jgi:hypothetical protein
MSWDIRSRGVTSRHVDHWPSWCSGIFHRRFTSIIFPELSLWMYLDLPSPLFLVSDIHAVAWKALLRSLLSRCWLSATFKLLSFVFWHLAQYKINLHLSIHRRLTMKCAILHWNDCLSNSSVSLYVVGTISLSREGIVWFVGLVCWFCF